MAEPDVRKGMPPVKLPRDEFEKNALARLSADPDRPVYSFEDFKGRPSLRYATAKRMKRTCVDCHNGHDDSTKRDWKEGDVPGVLEIIRPLDADVVRAREGLYGTFLGMGLISGRKAFQRPLGEGIKLLEAIQDVYLCEDVKVA